MWVDTPLLMNTDPLSLLSPYPSITPVRTPGSLFAQMTPGEAAWNLQNCSRGA
jgi:hypothetical protein